MFLGIFKNYKRSFMNRLKINKLQLVIFTLLMSFISVASAGGGLQAGTNALEEFKTWLFSIAGIGALVYLIYNITMAFMERKQWNEVGMAFLYCSVAGGALVGGNWMLTLFK